MKLLFDANLSPQLVRRLADPFPGSVHVFDCGNIYKDDLLIWAFAKTHGLTIVSKDSDFHRMSFVHGPPPKVIWTRVGNGPTAAAERALRRNLSEIGRFDLDESAAFLIVDP